MSNTPANTGRTTRLSTETKASFKTTEFFAYIAILIGIFVASAVVAVVDHAWLYATVLTVGYMISRGIAKSGSREFYDRDADTNRR
jgi:hypothetical protein